MSAATRSRQPLDRMISADPPETPAGGLSADAGAGQHPVASDIRRTGANTGAPSSDEPKAPSRASFRHRNSWFGRKP